MKKPKNAKAPARRKKSKPVIRPIVRKKTAPFLKPLEPAEKPSLPIAKPEPLMPKKAYVSRLKAGEKFDLSHGFWSDLKDDLQHLFSLISLMFKAKEPPEKLPPVDEIYKE